MKDMAGSHMVMITDVPAIKVTHPIMTAAPQRRAFRSRSFDSSHLAGSAVTTAGEKVTVLLWDCERVCR